MNLNNVEKQDKEAFEIINNELIIIKIPES